MKKELEIGGMICHCQSLFYVIVLLAFSPLGHAPILQLSFLCYFYTARCIRQEALSQKPFTLKGRVEKLFFFLLPPNKSGTVNIVWCVNAMAKVSQGTYWKVDESRD